MCGIFGIATSKHRSWDDQLALGALNTLKHRGPDNVGHYRTDQCFIGHRRLSILDLSVHGDQPMASADCKVHVSVNGEIYNFRSLRDSLKGKYLFQSQSDSEVILNGYLHWGLNGLLEKIDGMFAFVILDENTRKVHLARDRVGIKPLYYFHGSDTTIWASELKAIEYYQKAVGLHYCAEAIYDFFTYGYVPTPKSLYRDVFKLPPAHFVTFDLELGDLSEPRRYWSLPTELIARTAVQAEAELRDCLHRSVKEQLVSDVPLGCFLSGGIDSSCVVAEAARVHSRISTYTVGFDGPDDEAPYAALMAKRAGTDHHVQYFRESDLELSDKLKLWFDEPFADSSALPTYLVAKFARLRCTVALSGDGGDELFGGYRRYALIDDYMKSHGGSTKSIARFFLKAISGANHPFLVRLRSKLGYMGGYTPLELNVKFHSGMVKPEKRVLATSLGIPRDYDDYWYFRSNDRPDLSLRRRLQWLDFHTYLHDDILTKVDRTTMQVSLEARVPFLSRELTEFAFSLDEALIYPQGELKGLLKRAYGTMLDPGTIRKVKQGFSIRSSIEYPTPAASRKQVLNLFVPLKDLGLG